MITITNFYRKFGAWKVMSQHIFPSLTVAMLTLFTLNLTAIDLLAQTQGGVCSDPPPLELQVTAETPVHICAGSSEELSVSVSGGSQGVSRTFGVLRLSNNTNLFIKGNLDNTGVFAQPLGSSNQFGPATFVEGEYYTIDLDQNELVTIDTLSYAIDSVATLTPEPNHYWVGLAYDAVNSELYAISTHNACNENSVFYHISLNSGIATPLFPINLDCIQWLGIDNSGEAYVLNGSDNSLYSLNLINGDVELIGDIGQDVTPCTGGGFDPVSGELYITVNDGTEVTGLLVNPQTGESGIVDVGTGSICGLALLNHSFTGYQFSWSPTTGLSDPDIANPVASPNTSTTYTVTVTDACGETATAQVLVNVEQPLPPSEQISCVSYVQVSVNENCEAIITPDMILTGGIPCANEFHEVEIIGRQGNLVTGDDVGETLNVMVTRIGNLGNRCWGNISVEDKLPPVIECVNDTLSCLEVRDYILPIATDNCGIDTIRLLNEVIDTEFCEPDFIRRVVRIFDAIDNSGNVSMPCVQEILVERVDFSEVIFPDDFTKVDDTALSCDEGFPVLSNGNPSPERTGYPQLNGLEITPIVDIYCGFDASYSDTPVSVLGCKEKIMRTWVIREWRCDGMTITRSHVQEIEIIDTSGPVLTCPPDITVTTSSNHSCSATVFIPVPSAYDVCNEVDRIDLAYPGGFQSNWPGGLLDLPGGINELVFTAYDNCWPFVNSSNCTMTVTVLDQTPPVPVCRENTVVSLTIDGTARVYAESFDNASYDECGPITLDVRRMEQGCDINLPIFRPYVDFYCCDLISNPIMVVLRVTDESGNQNECMVNVEVQDKLPAAITCPPNITVSCEYPFDFDDLSVFGKVVIVSDLAMLQDPSMDPREDIVIDDIGNPNTQPQNWGKDGFVYDNCAIQEPIMESYNDNIEMCGTGTITRTFTAMSINNTISAVCHQTIQINNYSTFNSSNITWPDDIMLLNTCMDSPDTHPDNTGYPELDAGICDLVHFDYKDQVFHINSPNDPTCFKIVRTWTVIDWCQFENGRYYTWTWDQAIKVTINDAPVITGNCEDFTVNSIDPDCQSAPVSLTQSATSICTAEGDLNWRYDIDVNNNGIFELSSDNNPFANNPSDPTDASGNYPLGQHRIVWTVTDGCGNKTSCQQIFTVLNMTQPKVICRSITVELMPMDTNGDGTANWAMLEVNAALFNNNSYHNCGYGISFSFSNNPADQTRVFTCDDLGDQMVDMYVHASNGTSDFCRVIIEVQDNNEVCPPGSGSSGGGSSGLISGLITMEDGEGVKDAEIRLVGSTLTPVMSATSGNYQFPAMPFGGSYEVLPIKDENPLEGVTTYDIALMQRHILGTQFFHSPYQWIAADIDNNGVVDVRDVSALRRMVLGVHDHFQDNMSWRFVDADFQFTGFNPLDEQFNESYRIPNFYTNMTGLDFIAVKIGDLNNSVDPSGLNTSDERSQKDQMVFEVMDSRFEKGELIEVEFTARNFQDIDAFQFTLLFEENLMELLEVRSEALRFESTNIGTQALDQGVITVSWNDILPVSVSEDEVLFTFVFESQSFGNLASSIQISSLVTQARAYERGNAKNIGLEFLNLQTDSQNFELYQNRPNPFTDETVIGFRLAEDTEVVLTVFDVTGKVVRSFEGLFNKGYNELRLNDLGDWPGQVYYYRLDADGFSATKKMILVR